jgi:hypothetical protein
LQAQVKLWPQVEDIDKLDITQAMQQRPEQFARVVVESLQLLVEPQIQAKL